MNISSILRLNIHIFRYLRYPVYRSHIIFLIIFFPWKKKEETYDAFQIS